MSEDIISYIEKRLKEKGKIKGEKPKEEKKEKKKEKRKKEKKKKVGKPKLKLKFPKIKVFRPKIEVKKKFAVPQPPPVKYVFLERNQYGSLAIDEEEPVLYVWLSAKDDETYRKWKFLAPLIMCQDIYEIFTSGANIAVSHRKFPQRLEVKYVNARVEEADVLKLAMNVAILSGARFSLENPLVYTTLDDWRIQIYGLSSHGSPSLSLTRVVEVPKLTSIVDSLLASRILLLVLGRLPTVIYGAAGVGKTTLMNSIVNEIMEIYESLLRVLIIEQVPELRVPQKATVTKIVVGPEGSSELTLDKAIGEAVQRARPDILVVGELDYRSVSAWVLALSSGSCCLTTFHAENFEQCVNKLYSQMKVAKIVESINDVFNYVKCFIEVKAARTVQGVVRIVSRVIAVSPRGEIVEVYGRSGHLSEEKFLKLVDSTIVSLNTKEEYIKLKNYFMVEEAKSPSF